MVSGTLLYVFNLHLAFPLATSATKTVAESSVQMHYAYIGRFATYGADYSNLSVSFLIHHLITFRHKYKINFATKRNIYCTLLQNYFQFCAVWQQRS